LGKKRGPKEEEKRCKEIKREILKGEQRASFILPDVFGYRQKVLVPIYAREKQE